MYRATHLESIRALAKAYYAANKEAVDERIRRSIAAKPEKYQAIHAAWKQANKDAVNASTHKRRAAVKGNGGKWTASEWQAIKAAQEYLCLMCGRKEPDIRLCFDHIIPVSLGGPNTAANGQGLCKSCNSKKHRRVLDLRKEV
jgi:5-methylcytosine-specific restriction endonuclease McrA